jgi:hypothetical protein
MLTLIIREIEDNRAFFILAIIIALIFCAFYVSEQYYDKDSKAGTITTLIFIFTFFGMFVTCGMGASQMYWDRMKKISALLSTLAVTRNQIFTARVISGVLLIIVGFLPAIATIWFASNLTAEERFLRTIISPETGILIFLFYFACYGIGLQSGWVSNKLMPTIGALGFSFILSKLVWTKGFGWDCYVILILLIVCCLLRAWRTFSKAAF